jgi:hypothetical protein
VGCAYVVVDVVGPSGIGMTALKERLGDAGPAHKVKFLGTALDESLPRPNTCYNTRLAPQSSTSVSSGRRSSCRTHILVGSLPTRTSLAYRHRHRLSALS